MTPLKIAFLWHQHQPYYKYEDEFILPWVRFHGVKDYYDLVALLHEFPKIKQNFNIVPSLILQIDEYLSGKVKDRVQILTLKSPESLTNDEKREILKTFFTCNLENLIKPYSRYYELYLKYNEITIDFEKISNQDILDLQVWYNLAWIGEISKLDKFISSLFSKGSDFTQTEKEILLNKHNFILAQIVDELQNLQMLGKIGLSFSPFYHPILPLISDLNVGEENEIPFDFKYPEDADIQIKKGIIYFKNKFNYFPEGSWSSEGSLSNEVLDLYIKNNIKWVAGDEEILKRSRGIGFIETEKFFPVKYLCEKGEITIFFRDHFLSDRIGFNYSNWNEDEAANDFINHLHSIRNEIINKHSEQDLKSACVSIVLDGENCWEFYKNNGFDFLRLLYTKLSNDQLIETVILDDIASIENNLFPKLNSIYPGSWINANFDIWRGHCEDIAAWKMLKTVRDLIEQKKDSFDKEKLNKVMELVYIAEGSDWFWWYGEDHFAPNDTDFDKLFRYYILKIYNELAEKAPDSVFIPIMTRAKKIQSKNAERKINPIFNGRIDGIEEWLNAGFLRPEQQQSTMHIYGKLFEGLHFGNNESNLFIRIDFTPFFHNFILNNPSLVEIKLNDLNLNFEFKNNATLLVSHDSIEDLEFIYQEIFELKIPISHLKSEEVKISIEIQGSSNKEFIPNDKELIYRLV